MAINLREVIDYYQAKVTELNRELQKEEDSNKRRAIAEVTHDICQFLPGMIRFHKKTIEYSNIMGEAYGGDEYEEVEEALETPETIITTKTVTTRVKRTD